MNREAAIALATRLYAALATWDLPVLQEILHPDFHGQTTAGLPLGLGGSYADRDDMLQRFWRRIGQSYIARAVPTRFSLCDDERLLVEGTYEGNARKGRPLRAAFVHVLAFEGVRIRSLTQLTDSQTWTDALRPPTPTAAAPAPQSEHKTQYVRYSFDAGLATITLQRPKQRNALDLALAQELVESVRKLPYQEGLRAVLITGDGPVFTVGGDVAAFASTPHENLPELLESMVVPYHQALSILDALPAPIVCAVQGAAAGGGLGLLYCSDIVLAAPNTRFAAGFAALGLTGDGGGTWFLPRVAGAKRAAEFYFEQRVLNSEEAMAWGLVNRVVPAETLLEEATQTAQRLAEGPSAAFARVRGLLRRSGDNALDTQLTAEARELVASSRTEDVLDGIASFIAKRKPTFRGR